jgi:hypothetical protein
VVPTGRGGEVVEPLDLFRAQLDTVCGAVLLHAWGPLRPWDKATLAAMRASPNDPARSPEAIAKKRAKSRSTSLAMRAWERKHGRGDRGLYDREVVPRIQQMTVPQLMTVTGLSQFHCWKVRKGERRLHARHWEAVLLAAETSSD